MFIGLLRLLLKFTPLARTMFMAMPIMMPVAATSL